MLKYCGIILKKKKKNTRTFKFENWNCHLSRSFVYFIYTDIEEHMESVKT